MTEDTKKILDEIERELLLAQDPMEEDELLADLPESLLEEDKQMQVDAALERILSESQSEGAAFEDPDQTNVPQEPVNVCNYYNDYGRDIPEESQKEEPEAKKKKEDMTLVILMAVASFLCLGIIGVLIYWIEAFLK